MERGTNSEYRQLFPDPLKQLQIFSNISERIVGLKLYFGEKYYTVFTKAQNLIIFNISI
jgi:hypothetical protein